MVIDAEQILMNEGVNEIKKERIGNFGGMNYETLPNI